MWRTALLAALAYGYGHPVLEDYRPAALDRPMQAFHTEINHIARDGYRVVASLDNTRVGRLLRSYVESVDRQLRPKDGD